jgi:hypothetical protein
MIAGGVGAAGSIAGAAIGSNAAGNAASTQANAANQSAQLQYQASQNALNFEKQQYNQSQSNMAPWLQSGAGALGNLDYLLGITPPTTQGTMTGGAITPSGIGIRPTGGPISGGTGSVAPGTGIQAHGGPVLPTATANAMGGPGSVYAGSGSAPSGMMPTSGAVSGGSGSVTPGHSPLGIRPTPGVMPSPQVGGVPGGPNGATGGAVNFGSTSQQPGGTTNLGAAVNPSLGGFGSLMAANPYSTFTAPTGLTEQNDPGYQARLNLGMDAMDRSAAARGSVLTGGTAQAENQAAQDYASNEYGNVYNRAFNTNAANFNQFSQNQNNQYNRLASLAGIGQQSAQQLGYLGSNAANGVSNNLLQTAGMMGQDYQNAAAANASGYYNQAQAINGGISGGLNSMSQYMQLLNLQNGGAMNYGGGSGLNELNYLG